MTIKQLKEYLDSIGDENKRIEFVVNDVNPEDPQYDITCAEPELWNDGDESITFFLHN